MVGVEEKLALVKNMSDALDEATTGICGADCAACRMWHPQEMELLAHFLSAGIRENATLPAGEPECRSSVSSVPSPAYDARFMDTILAKSARDAQRGKRFPITHCAFRNCDCKFCGHEELYDHIIQDHGDIFKDAYKQAHTFVAAISEGMKSFVEGMNLETLSDILKEVWNGLNLPGGKPLAKLSITY